jgi:hypothetical protein
MRLHGAGSIVRERRLRLWDVSPVTWGHEISKEQSGACRPGRPVSAVLCFGYCFSPRCPLQGGREAAGGCLAGEEERRDSEKGAG